MLTGTNFGEDSRVLKSKWDGEREFLFQKLDDRLVQWLQASGWKDPSVLCNALYNEFEAVELVREAVGLKETEVQKDRWVKELWAWSQAAEEGV